MIDRTDSHWYQNAIIYELHVKAFFDSNGDGVGDFAGLLKKLDYIAELGVTAVWLLPFYPSPLRDDGYDIAEYTAINETYGTMRDFRQFVAEAHARGIRVITELVVNHTSDQHPWFQRARNAKPSSRYRDYYVWSDTDQKYQDTRIIFLDTEVSNWTWDPVAQSYFWHRFYSHQPDLNYDNPRVLADIMKVMRYWLDIGVDGLRLDAVPYLIERDGTNNENLPQTHDILKQFRAEIDANYSDRMLLAEANQWPEDTRPYFGDGDECHMAFHFPLMPRIYMSLAREDRYPITDIINQTPNIPEHCQWAIFLRNHDELTLEMVTDSERDYLWQTYATEQRARLNLGIRRRLAPLLDNDRRKIELLNGLLLSMPGTPVIYYGDELGMGDNFYLGDRDGVRTPMQWSSDRNGGFSRADPQRLFLPPIMDPIYGYQSLNVEAQEKDPHSLLNWTKRMIAVRKSHHAFGQGSLTFLYPSNRKVLAYLREHDGDTILCVFNLSRTAQAVELDLSEKRGHIPVEMTGRSIFPAIGTLPYLLTMPAYGFYWFDLTEAASLAMTVEPEPEPLPELETVVLAKGWALVESHLTDPKRQERFMRTLLPAYVHNQRWFQPKEARIREAKPLVFGELPRGRDESFLLLGLDLDLSNETEPRYFLPLAQEWGEHNLHYENPAMPYTLAKIRRGPRAGVVQEAAASPDFARTVVKAMQRGETLPANNGSLRLHNSRWLTEIEYRDDDPVRPVTAEQTNTGIVVGQTTMLKLYRQLRQGIQPEIELGRYLSFADFANVPSLLGSMEHVDTEGNVTALAAAFAHIPNQGDGWSVIVDALERELEDARFAEEMREDSKSGLPYSLSLIKVIGKRTAELHRTLAANTEDPAFAPEPVTQDDLDRWIDRLHARTADIFELLNRIEPNLDENSRRAVDDLLSMREVLVERLERLLPKGSQSQKIRVHGDYHLSQVLIAQADIYIVDFEGELNKSLEERRAKAPPARDIATMLRSFDYAATMAIEGLRQAGVGQPDEIEERALIWRQSASRTFLEAYTAVLVEAGDTTLDNSAQELLPFFLADKLLYEITYEALNRPAWLWVPIKAAMELIEENGPVPPPEVTD
ncbi:maltose alpha-D-glucosyltransferase [Methyloligella sp. 2.7D]|uniref:maltose alpha-D-glucosyltransferase n=1 Tax=unclassified Methyloligella TaxID=2625955 RepID=UPI00157DCA05|nr:maltose alpha-D-glucosyltransferase [Methyloligella sp. GL2]QKP78734.1 maltose alpha-D-glucosyltransferase [Methyloligella sp. GL2]